MCSLAVRSVHKLWTASSHTSVRTFAHVRTHMVDSFASSPADTQVPIICIHPSILDGCDHRSLESRISHKKKDARYMGVRVRVM